MAALKDIAAFLDERLEIAKYRSDASNNGLQFEAGADVRKAVFAVDASYALFSTAADLDADFLFVHHGISWGGSLKRILSLDAKRVSMLAANSISLYGAHLPLDAHPEIGHNAQFAKMMHLENPRPFGEYDSHRIGFQGVLPKETVWKRCETAGRRAALGRTVPDLRRCGTENHARRGDFRRRSVSRRLQRTVCGRHRLSRNGGNDA